MKLIKNYFAKIKKVKSFARYHHNPAGKSIADFLLTALKNELNEMHRQLINHFNRFVNIFFIFLTIGSFTHFSLQKIYGYDK